MPVSKNASNLNQGEIINLHFGQGGCQFGASCWKLYCLEHNVRPDGIACQNGFSGFTNVSFTPAGANRLVPRASFIDLEPSVIDEIRVGQLRSLFNPRLLITGKEDAANCFARGYFSHGHDILELVLHQIRYMVEDCHRLQGFLLFRTYSGGTGSGFVSKLLESLTTEYPKKFKFEFALYPSPNVSSVVVEPYNAALATHEALEHIDGSFYMDNEAFYDISDRLLDVCLPNYDNVNSIMSQIIASATSSLRFEGPVNINFNDMQTNLIPFPRIHHIILSYAPLLSRQKIAHENITETLLLNACFEPANQTAKVDTRKGKYVACTILYRGDVNNAMISAGIQSVKSKKFINFVDWSPTGFKVGVNSMPPVSLAGIGVDARKACVMLSNSTALRSAWMRMCRKFDLMFAKKAFLHWFLGEGLEENDFRDTRLDIGTLETDYAEIESDNNNTKKTS